jgi:5'-nucleotidase
MVRPSMREIAFLITNDDGIGSPLLAALVAALRPHGATHVVAPAAERSWIGKAISRHARLRPRRCDARFDCPAWAVDGTPADCVNLALGHLVPAVDMVVSGINLGSNAGLPLILASGTVGGALEGALHGRHALACSIRFTMAEFARLAQPGGSLPAGLAAPVRCVAERTAGLCAALARRPRPRRFVVHNLNFPSSTVAATPLIRTLPAAFEIGTLFQPEPKNGRYAFTFAVGGERPSPRPTDRSCLDAGRASHSVLDFGRLGVPRGVARPAAPPPQRGRRTR